MKNYLDQVGLWECPWGVVLIADWCRKTHLNVRSAISGIGSELFKNEENQLQTSSQQRCTHFSPLWTVAVLWLAVWVPALTSPHWYKCKPHPFSQELLQSGCLSQHQKGNQNRGHSSLSWLTEQATHSTLPDKSFMSPSLVFLPPPLYTRSVGRVGSSNP